MLNSTRLVTPHHPLNSFALNVASELVINKCGYCGNVLLHHYVVEGLTHAGNEL